MIVGLKDWLPWLFVHFSNWYQVYILSTLVICKNFPSEINTIIALILLLFYNFSNTIHI